MEYITTYVYQLLQHFSIPSTPVVLGNSIGDYAVAGTIFLLGLVIFSLVQRFVLLWLANLSARTETNLDDTFVKIVRSFKPPFYLFLSFWLAIRFIELSGIAETILTAILVVWLVYQAVLIVGILVEDVVFAYLVKEDDETAKSALHLLANIVKGVMWVFGSILILSNFGIDVTSLVAGAGIAGIAIAFALQGILSDLFSSFSLYFDKPFKVGDFIVVNDTAGVVKKIGVKTTRIQALSGEEVVLSNQDLTSAKIQNYKLMEERRVVFMFGILYETERKKIVPITAEIKKIIEGIQNTRFDRVHLKGFGDSSLDFEVVYYVLDSDYNRYMDMQQEINLAIMEYFEKEQIGFAYPTRTIYMAPTENNL